MAQPKAKAKPAEERSPLFKDHRKLAIYFKKEQAAALVAEARRRADERGAIRADVSEVVRELVDGWLAKGGRR